MERSKTNNILFIIGINIILLLKNTDKGTKKKINKQSLASFILSGLYHKATK
jgi:hypothetical protein